MSGGPTIDGIYHLLNLLRGGESPIGNFHVALVMNLPPGFTIGGEELDEPDVTEYTRAVMSNDSANWDISDTTMTNLLELTFPTALVDWGQVNYWAMCDQPLALGGRVLFCGQFDEPTWVQAGDQFYLNPGDLSVSMSGNQWLMGIS